MKDNTEKGEQIPCNRYKNESRISEKRRNLKIKTQIETY